jgi:hypothetical protein
MLALGVCVFAQDEVTTTIPAPVFAVPVASGSELDANRTDEKLEEETGNFFKVLPYHL